MMTIAEYVRTQPRQNALSVHFTMADYYERAAVQQREALRLFQAGNSRQAEVHAYLARKHALAAIEMHSKSSQNDTVY